MARNGRGVSAGGGQSQLGYLFGGSDEPKPNNRSMPPVEKPAPTSQSYPAVDVSKQVPAGIQVQVTETNNYQSQLGYLFGGSDEPKPNNRSMPPVEKPAPTSHSYPVVDVSKQVPAGIQVQVTETNNYHRADGQNTGNFLTNRPSTKVHSAPGGGSSLGYLFGGGGN